MIFTTNNNSKFDFINKYFELVNMDNKVTARITEREAAIKAWLKELEEVKGAKFPVLPERIYEALDNIKVSNAIEELTPSIEIQEFINENEVEALVYEWFYDGGEVDNIYAEAASAYKTCLFDGKPGNTDLLELPDNEGFEMNPSLENPINKTWSGFCLDPVMNIWYEELATEFSNKFNEYYELNEELEINIDLDMVTDAYDELFHLKLVSLMREAFLKAFEKNPIQITTGKPFHIFIQRHERWPMHVLSLNE